MPKVKGVRYSDDFIIRMIQHRLWEEEQNFIMGVTGGPGKGKSWATLSICEEVDRNFNEDRIVFSVDDFIKLINKEPQLPTGSAIMYEEGSVTASNRDWYTDRNMILTSVVDTFRYRNYLLVFTTPFRGSLDKRIRNIFHAIFEMRRIDRKKREGIGSLQFVNVHELIGTHGLTTYPKLRMIGKQGYGKMKEWRVPEPTTEIREKYETMKHEFASKFYRQLEENLKVKKEKAGAKRGVDINALVEKVKANPEKFKIKNKIVPAKIMQHLKVGQTTARDISILTRDEG